MKRACVVLAVAAFACNKDKGKAPPAASDQGSSPVEVKPPRQPTGPGLAPIVTHSITFAVPKAAPWWFEASFPCYAAAIGLQPGNRPSAAFAAISPAVEPAMRAADIDLDHDVAAIGGFGCGGGNCIYLAVTLHHPDKLEAMFAAIAPGYRKLAPDHFAISDTVAKGARDVHVRVVPLAHVDDLPSDPWARDAAKATHLLFITGLLPGSKDVDPLPELETGAAALAHVQTAQGVVKDAGGTCVIGTVGKQDFTSGFALDHARFAFVLPEQGGDAFTHLLGSKRTMDVEVELVLDKPPSEQQMQQWIDQARAYMAQIAEPIRQQYASQGPLVDVITQMAGAIGEHGFQHHIKDRTVVLSWRSDRIPSSDLTAYEAQLRGAMGILPP
jgi:hypothetical protein